MEKFPKALADVKFYAIQILHQLKQTYNLFLILGFYTLEYNLLI